MFNSGYTVGLQLLYLELHSLGIALRLPVPKGPFWCDSSRVPDGTNAQQEFTTVLDAVSRHDS